MPINRRYQFEATTPGHALTDVIEARSVEHALKRIHRRLDRIDAEWDVQVSLVDQENGTLWNYKTRRMYTRPTATTGDTKAGKETP